MRHPFLFVVVLAVVAGAAAGGAPELLEVARTDFEVPLDPNSGSSIAFAAHASAVYAVSGSDLFVVDPEGGAVTDVVDLALFQSRSYRDSWQLGVSQWLGEHFLVLWNTSDPDLQVFSLADPWHPVFRNEVRTLQREVERVVLLPGLPIAFALDYWGDLYWLTGGPPLPRPPFPGRPRGPFATALRADRPILAGFSEERSGPTTRFWVTTIDIFALSVWSRIEVTTGEAVRTLLLGPDASLLVIGYWDWATKTARFETRDPRTGALLASFAPPGNGRAAVLAGGGDTLVVVDPAGVDLIDLADPASPRIRGRVEAGLMPAPWWTVPRPVASPTERVAFVPAAGAGTGAVLAIDVDAASIVGRWDAGRIAPRRIDLARDPSGVVRAAVVSAKIVGVEVLERGGLSRFDLLDASVATDLVETGRIDRVVPERIEGFEVLGGRYGVVDDPDHNALVLFELATGEIVDAGGFFRRSDRNFPDWPYEQRIQSAGNWVVGMAGQWYERIEVRDGRLVPHSTSDLDGAWLTYGRIRDDGLMVMQVYRDGAYHVRTEAADGRTGSLELPFAPSRITLAPSGNRLLLEAPSFYEDAAIGVVDLSAPEAPRLLWEGFPQAASAQFLPGEDRVLATTDFFAGSFRVQVLDAGTGEPLGAQSEPVRKFYYHDRGTAFGRPPDTRAVFWKWTFTGWETVVFDVDTDPPQVLAVLPDFGSFPEYLPRGTDRGWTEFQRNPWGGTSRMYLGEPDASQRLVLAEVADWEQPRAVRHGFFAAQEQAGKQREIVLWRDTALNRPPVARAGGDRAVECASPAGTEVVLDASSSTDPDSTPGTRDDLAGFSWTLDGTPAANMEIVPVELAVGEYRAELTVEDVLGARASDLATVSVQDTLAPAVSLDLEPVVSGGQFAHEWLPAAGADDLCEGAIAPLLLLQLLAGADSLPAGFLPSPLRAIEVRGASAPDTVRLLGPDESAMRALWDRARANGALGLEPGSPVTLLVDDVARPGGPVPFVRYELNAAGSVERALAFGAGADFGVEATASDAAGNGAGALTSLRETIARLCAALPASAACAPRNRSQR